MPPPIPIFPAVPQGFPLKWKPTFKTTIMTSSCGREVRWANQQLALHEFELLFEVLRDQTQNDILYQPLVGFTDYMKLCQHWLMMYGQFGLFYFDAPWDNSRVEQQIGVGDGATTGFVATRTFGTGVPSLTEYVGGLNDVMDVEINAVVQDPTTYTVDGNGIIFTTPPGTGLTITATYSFYYLCRFLDDKQDFEEFFKNYWTVKSLKFRSVSLGGDGFVDSTGVDGAVP